MFQLIVIPQMTLLHMQLINNHLNRSIEQSTLISRENFSWRIAIKFNCSNVLMSIDPNHQQNTTEYNQGWNVVAKIHYHMFIQIFKYLHYFLFYFFLVKNDKQSTKLFLLLLVVCNKIQKDSLKLIWYHSLHKI